MVLGPPPSAILVHGSVEIMNRSPGSLIGKSRIEVQGTVIVDREGVGRLVALDPGEHDLSAMDGICPGVGDAVSTSEFHRPVGQGHGHGGGEVGQILWLLVVRQSVGEGIFLSDRPPVGTVEYIAGDGPVATVVTAASAGVAAAGPVQPDRYLEAGPRIRGLLEGSRSAR